MVSCRNVRKFFRVLCACEVEELALFRVDRNFVLFAPVQDVVQVLFELSCVFLEGLACSIEADIVRVPEPVSYILEQNIGDI